MAQRKLQHIRNPLIWCTTTVQPLTLALAIEKLTAYSERVAEGVATFDSIYDKVQMATNQSQKGKT